MYLISTVVCQMSTLYCGSVCGGGGGGPEIFPVCPDVDSMCWMCNYRNIFIIGR